MADVESSIRGRCLTVAATMLTKRVYHNIAKLFRYLISFKATCSTYHPICRPSDASKLQVLLEGMSCAAGRQTLVIRALALGLG